MSKKTDKKEEEILTKEFRMENLEKLKKSFDETKSHKKASRVLIGIHGLLKIFLELSEGKSIVINSDGEIFTGEVSTKNLWKRPETLAGKKDLQFIDGQGRQEFFRSKSWVQSPGTSFKNAWDSQVLKKPDEKEAPILEAFLLAVNYSPDSNIKMGDSITGNNGTFFCVEAIKQKIKAWFDQKTGNVVWLEYQGKKFELY